MAPVTGYAKADKVATAATTQPLWRRTVFISRTPTYPYRLWNSQTLRRHAPTRAIPNRDRPLVEYSLVAFICCTFQEFGGVRATIKVGALLYIQGLRAGLRQRIRGELHDLGQLQGLAQLLPLSPPTDSDIAHTGCVVLELLSVRPFTLAALCDDQNVLVAAGRNTDLLTCFFYGCAVRPVERGRRVALRVAGCPRPRVRLHHDSCTRAIHAGDPGATALELSLVVYFDQLTLQPDVAVLVLREENDLRFLHLAALGSFALLRQSAAAGQSETNENRKHGQGRCSLTQCDRCLCHPGLLPTYVHFRHSQRLVPLLEQSGCPSARQYRDRNEDRMQAR